MGRAGQCKGKQPGRLLLEVMNSQTKVQSGASREALFGICCVSLCTCVFCTSTSVFPEAHTQKEEELQRHSYEHQFSSPETVLHVSCRLLTVVLQRRGLQLLPCESMTSSVLLISLLLTPRCRCQVRGKEVPQVGKGKNGYRVDVW